MKKLTLFFLVLSSTTHGQDLGLSGLPMPPSSSSGSVGGAVSGTGSGSTVGTGVIEGSYTCKQSDLDNAGYVPLEILNRYIAKDNPTENHPFYIKGRKLHMNGAFRVPEACLSEFFPEEDLFHAGATGNENTVLALGIPFKQGKTWKGFRGCLKKTAEEATEEKPIAWASRVVAPINIDGIQGVGENKNIRIGYITTRNAKATEYFPGKIDGAKCVGVRKLYTKGGNSLLTRKSRQQEKLERLKENCKSGNYQEILSALEEVKDPQLRKIRRILLDSLFFTAKADLEKMVKTIKSAEDLTTKNQRDFRNILKVFTKNIIPAYKKEMELLGADPEKMDGIQKVLDNLGLLMDKGALGDARLVLKLRNGIYPQEEMLVQEIKLEVASLQRYLNNKVLREGDDVQELIAKADRRTDRAYKAAKKESDKIAERREIETGRVTGRSSEARRRAYAHSQAVQRIGRQYGEERQDILKACKRNILGQVSNAVRCRRGIEELQYLDLNAQRAISYHNTQSSSLMRQSTQFATWEQTGREHRAKQAGYNSWAEYQMDEMYGDRGWFDVDMDFDDPSYFERYSSGGHMFGGQRQLLDPRDYSFQNQAIGARNYNQASFNGNFNTFTNGQNPYVNSYPSFNQRGPSYFGAPQTFGGNNLNLQQGFSTWSPQNNPSFMVQPGYWQQQNPYPTVWQ